MPEPRHVAVNGRILACLDRGALPARSAWSRRDPELAGFELRCHPDLVERLDAAGRGLHARFTWISGLPVLVHPAGVIFAAADGTSRMLVRLPADAGAGVVRSRWGNEGLGDDWVDVDPWLAGDDALDRLRQWCRDAYEYAATLRD